MKRFIVILLVIQLSLLTGCTLPLIGEISPPSEADAGQEMLVAPDNSGQSALSGQSGIQLNTQADSQTGTQSGVTSSSITVETQDGTASAVSFDPAAEIADQPALTDISSGSAVVSNPTGSAVAGEMYQNPLDAETSEAAVQTDSGRTTDVTETGYPVTVYYQDGDGCLIPMTRWIQMQQGIARAAVSLCVDSAIAREEVAYYGVYPVIPVDTQILGITIRDGIAVVDFDKHLLHYADAVSERNTVASIVYTLTEFKNIDKVRILVNGYPQTVLKYGTDISEALGRENVAINSTKPNPLSGQGKVDVFFLKKANEGFTYMAPVSFAAERPAGESDSNAQTAKLLVQQLIDRDGEFGTFSEIPDGVEILGCSAENGIVTIDFNESFINYGGSEKEESILKQLAYTIRQIDGIKRLKITVDGLPVQLPEGSDISSGLVIPATINDVMDR